MNHENRPEFFVYLQDIDPTIQQSVRYASSQNFLGRIVPGYQSTKIICTLQAAQALQCVQKTVQNEGYSLVVYDAYRPQQSVDAFKNWSFDHKDLISKHLYYPTISKEDMLKLGYVAGQYSSHTRGSTFDLTLIKNDLLVTNITERFHVLSNEEKIPFLDDGTIDMGSSFDLFHEVSHHNTPLINPNQKRNREILHQAMIKNGFKDYPCEWWHYTLINEPYPDTYFNFEII